MNTNQHILIIDDDPDDVEIMKEAFSCYDLNFYFSHAANGKEGLAFLNSSASLPALIILDMNMPVLDGKTTLQLLKKEKRFNPIPVVVFTTSSNENDRDYCNSYGVEMITKPDSIKLLGQTVEQIILLCRT